MSAAIKYYYNHKDQVLQYKKEYYSNKTYKYSFFKNIVIKGFSKRDSKKLIKTEIDNNNIEITLNDNEFIDFYEFLQKYKIKDYSIIEIDYIINNNKLILNFWSNQLISN